MCQTVATVRVGDIVELTRRTRRIGGNGRWDGTTSTETFTATIITAELAAGGQAFDVDFQREDGTMGSTRLMRDPSQQPTWGISDWRLVGHTLQRA